MNDDPQSRFWRNWGCIVIGVGFLALTSLCPALGEKRPVGAFAEIFLARLIMLGSPCVAFAVAFLVKEKTEDITGQSWLAWILAVTAFVLLVFAGIWIGSKIPGVNWRIKHFDDDIL